MRKLMIALAFVGLGTMTATAQETEVPAKKHSVATNSFWANWFVSAGINSIASYSSQENCSNVNPFSVDRTTLGFNVAVGKWFTPGIGLRTKVDALWLKQVNSRTSHPSFQYSNVHEDVMFNLTNMFCGYNKDRLYNAIPYVGIGWARNWDNEADEISYNIGLINNFRINDRVSIFAEIFASMSEGSLDGANPDRWAASGKWVSRHWDKQVGLSVGVTFNTSKTVTWEKVPDVEALMAMNQEQMDALNQSLKEQQDENARLREMIANQQNQPVVEQTTTNTVSGYNAAASVFFNINSARIASRKDLVNVKEVVEYAKANNLKIVVAGYADSKTGTAAYNQQLSEKRANAVANELVKMGMNRDNIVIEAKGGVNNLSPFSYNRRATVKLQ